MTCKKQLLKLPLNQSTTIIAFLVWKIVKGKKRIAISME